MKKTWRSLAALLLVCALVLSVPAPTGPAHGSTPTAQPGATPAPGRDAPYTLAVGLGSAEDAAGMAVAGAEVELYQVAARHWDAEHSAYVYELDPAYAELTEAFNALTQPELHVDEGDAKAWDAFAQAAAGIALPVTGNETPQTCTAREAMPTAGTVRFEDLEAGLYLVAVHDGNPGYAVTTYDKRIATRTRGAETTYTCFPQMAAVPSPEEIGIKAARELVPGTLTINKTLESYVPGQPGTFVFQIEARLEDEDGNGWTVYSDVVTLTFTGSGTQSVELTDVPRDEDVVVTVTEVYTGASYALTSAREQTVVFDAEGNAAVSFTNTAADGNRGGAVNNHFTKNADGWAWTPEPDVTRGAGA